jgi:hypothetical protein
MRPAAVRENVRRWKPLPNKGNENVTVDNGVCITLNCKVESRAVSKSSISPVINPKPSKVTLRKIVTLFFSPERSRVTIKSNFKWINLYENFLAAPLQKEEHTVSMVKADNICLYKQKSTASVV